MLNNYLLKSFLFFVLIILHSIAFGKNTLSGKVVEKASGEVLPFATVVIEGTVIGTTTNVDGFFSLFDIESNEVTLVVSYVGYQTITLDVVLNGSKDLLIIELEPITSQLEEVLVVANANKILNASSGVSTTTISTKQLELLPSIGETDIFRSLQLLPGVSGTNENSSGLFVRGGTPDQNLVLLDGITIYKVDHFFGFFSAFNANAIKDVQLHKGAFPAQFGGRTSSVVELTGKTGSFEKIQGGFNVNLLSVNGYFEAPITKNLSFLIAGRRSYTDVLQTGLFESISDSQIGDDGFNDPTIDDSEVTTLQPDFYFYDWNSKLSYRPSEKDLITVSVYNGQDFLDESRNLTRDIQGPAVPTTLFFDLFETTDYGNKGISGKWSRQWNPKFYSNFLVAGSEFFSTFNRDGFAEVVQEDTTLFSLSQQSFEDNNVVDISARADFEWQRSSRSKTDFGISYTLTKVDYNNVRDDTVIILQSNQEAQYGSIYVSNEQKIGNKLNLTTGLRLSKYENEDDLLWEPRANLTYQLTPKIKLKAAYGKHYQFVNRVLNESITEGAREFWLLTDGELVDISEADHYVLGASYEIDNWLFDVEGYYKDLSGLSEFSLRFRNDDSFDPNQLFFTGDGEAKGIEFLIQKKQGNYTGWASYTVGNIRNTFEDLNEGNEFPALHDQLHEFKMVHSYEVGQWVLSSTFIYGSGRPFSEPEGQYNVELLDSNEFNFVGIGDRNGSRLPAYHKLDVSAHYKFNIGKAKADLGLSIFNLYGRENISFVEYDFTQQPVLITDVTFLGTTPNISFGIDF
ncbi:MAG: TonB-dependent receptor [Bacteroidota bacterium]